MANRMPSNSGSLAAFLKDRRTRLDPASFGFSGRRRTPGLRREEVAQRANISPTWYTWLEQGRGGAPSADVLNRIAKGLLLTEAEREHLFMLGLGRPPEVRYRGVEGVSPRLQRLIDTLDASPAIVRTATWDVVAWNRAARVVLTDYSTLPEGERNILRFMFLSPHIRARQHDWQNLARFVVGAFRADAARAGAVSQVRELVDELCSASPEFAALWRENGVLSHGDGTKRLKHPELGDIELEYSGFAVDGRPDLSLTVYNPVDSAVADRIRALALARYPKE
ncbi:MULTISPECIES: helix-turn-helix transcriptional regulator [unclassified Mesorhizobium]|uniref:helix-turn-helix transcriptional regulator n=1 Tax=unclassified Mesorhizobium TaxID=325217 RepID=UPI000FCA11E3|nr:MULTISPECIES: helix-turn-helix transcriptional regulator [unclassified Mesorhizobium]RUZ89448.1 XRE family transcriptional regulator [Mesorhizobium sp. M7A.F.Ca.US.003.02.2.1]MBZ9890703.1 helix-turn-helix transcriptional regulator [Mesorhizobium sp. BR1-1-3]RUY95899.1 XRE family transcriptional regulator [Mesorhizobium sp. M7A.F.Ca.CA.001.12.2.1]RUZ23418.1 XRE family transcriptional regulator [Mesorhizobium sp. M7A.F.Ca.US.007.01.2.1]RUZ39916.1 XRE family transcriptional regulator [Mesorhiz